MVHLWDTKCFLSTCNSFLPPLSLKITSYVTTDTKMMNMKTSQISITIKLIVKENKATIQEVGVKMLLVFGKHILLFALKPTKIGHASNLSA